MKCVLIGVIGFCSHINLNDFPTSLIFGLFEANGLTDVQGKAFVAGNEAEAPVGVGHVGHTQGNAPRWERGDETLEPVRDLLQKSPRVPAGKTWRKVCSNRGDVYALRIELPVDVDEAVPFRGCEDIVRSRLAVEAAVSG